MVKRVLAALLGLAALLALSGCGQQESRERAASHAPEAEVSQPAKQPVAPAAGKKSLVVYFSQSGNTEAVARAIGEQTGAELWALRPQKPYTDDYDALLEIASSEQQNGARPAIATPLPDLGSYDVIYVGYPIWWGDMPMILYTFFEGGDFSGKTVVPFCTSGGSGLSGTVETIEQLAAGADVKQGLHVGSAAAADATGAVNSWLSELDLYR